jgi:uncharacterized protein
MKLFSLSRFTACALSVFTVSLTVAVTPVPKGGAVGNTAPSGVNTAPSGVSAAPGQLIPPSQFLPERAGFTSWRTLAQVELVKRNNKMAPSFAPAIAALDGKTSRVQGFMIPLDIGDNQKRFLLVAAPPHCSFCLPAGPDSMIEIRAKQGVRYRFEAVSLSGTFQLLKDDPAGLYYRLTDATAVE